MPLYEYKCTACGALTELLRTSDEKDDPAACEKCGSAGCERIFSSFSTADPFNFSAKGKNLHSVTR